MGEWVVWLGYSIVVIHVANGKNNSMRSLVGHMEALMPMVQTHLEVTHP